MHRLLVPTVELEKDAPVLPPEARAHLRVLRPKEGEEIELFDGRGRWRVYRYDRAAAAAAAAGIGIRDDGLRPRRPQYGFPGVSLQPLPSPLTLFACVTKGARWDWTIEKATELGATRLVPVLSERTIVRIAADEREAKRARWTRIAEEAARQSDAKWIPEVLAPVSFAESLALVRETRCFVGALATPPPPMIGDALSSVDAGARADGGFAIYVGPEGDFTPDELASLLEIATPVSFGSTILRAETAAIYGLSVLKAQLDRSLRSSAPPRAPLHPL